MKVPFVVACVEIARVQWCYSIQRETLIRAGICEVRCMRKTELHLTQPVKQPQSCSTSERFQGAVVPVKVENRPSRIYLFAGRRHYLALQTALRWDADMVPPAVRASRDLVGRYSRIRSKRPVPFSSKAISLRSPALSSAYFSISWNEAGSQRSQRPRIGRRE